MTYAPRLYDISMETTLDVKDSGKGDSGNAEEEHSEEAQVGRKSEAPEEGNCNNAGSGKSQSAAEATP